MPATERMKEYALLIATALDIDEPNYFNFDDTSEFISEHVEEFKSLDAKTRKEAQKNVNAKKYAIYDLESAKLSYHIGVWLSKKLKDKLEPFDSLENINAYSRMKLAENFWRYQLNRFSGWKTIEMIDGKKKTVEEILLFIAKDLDYRIAKSTAKYFFHLTSRSAGAIVIDPDQEPFVQVKFHYKVTYYILCNELENVFIDANEHREYVKKK